MNLDVGPIKEKIEERQPLKPFDKKEQAVIRLAQLLLTPNDSSGVRNVRELYSMLTTLNLSPETFGKSLDRVSQIYNKNLNSNEINSSELLANAEILPILFHLKSEKPNKEELSKIFTTLAKLGEEGQLTPAAVQSIVLVTQDLIAKGVFDEEDVCLQVDENHSINWVALCSKSPYFSKFFFPGELRVPEISLPENFGPLLKKYIETNELPNIQQQPLETLKIFHEFLSFALFPQEIVKHFLREILCKEVPEARALITLIPRNELALNLLPGIKKVMEIEKDNAVRFYLLQTFASLKPEEWEKVTDKTAGVLSSVITIFGENKSSLLLPQEARNFKIDDFEERIKTLIKTVQNGFQFQNLILHIDPQKLKDVQNIEYTHHMTYYMVKVFATINLDNEKKDKLINYLDNLSILLETLGNCMAFALADLVIGDHHKIFNKIAQSIIEKHENGEDDPAIIAYLEAELKNMESQLATLLPETVGDQNRRADLVKFGTEFFGYIGHFIFILSSMRCCNVPTEQLFDILEAWQHSKIPANEQVYTTIALLFPPYTPDDQFSSKNDYYTHLIKTLLPLMELNNFNVLLFNIPIERRLDVVTQAASQKDKNKQLEILQNSSWIIKK